MVAGTPVNDILLDTGAAKSMLHTRVVPNESLTGEKIVIRCAHADAREYPLAQVTVEVAGKLHTLLGAVSDTLLMSVLLGRDMPNLKDLIAVGDGETEIEVLATTRAQARKQQEAKKERVAERSGATLSPVEPPVTVVEEEEEATFGAEFDDSLFQGGWRKHHMTRQERRRHNQQYVQEQLGGLENQTGVSLGPLDLSASELWSMQQADESLQAVRQVARGQPSTVAGQGFFERDGLLYRRWIPSQSMGGGSEIEQLVLPTPCRKAVLQLAHEIPLTGHLGRKKTSQWILQRFYWPSLFKDVTAFCRTCERCQKMDHQRRILCHLYPYLSLTSPFNGWRWTLSGPYQRAEWAIGTFWCCVTMRPGIQRQYLSVVLMQNTWQKN